MNLTFTLRLPHWGISFAAGLAAAFAFLAGSYGALGYLLVNISPLPLMIAALGWGGSSGLVASCIAAIVIGTLTGARLALVFFGIVALPSLVLAVLSQWRPRAQASANGAFYPLPRLMAWICWAAIFSSMIEFAIWLSQNGGFEAATAMLKENFTNQLQAMVQQGLQLPASLAPEDFASLFAHAVPFIATMLQVVIFGVNLWLAALLTDASGQLQRRRPILSAQLGLPVHASLVGLGAIGLFLIGYNLPSISLMLAAGMIFFGLLTGFALEGFAVLHHVTRSLPLRWLLLTLVYFGVVFLTFWPVAIAAGVGVADSLYPLRRFPDAANPSNT